MALAQRSIVNVGSSYTNFLVNNAASISSIESSLRSLTWFLPGRFHDADLASEVAYAGLNVMGIYHDSIILRAVDKLPAHKRPAPSSHSRYTRGWADSSRAYKTCARLLTMLGYTELLLEMTARKRWGKDKQWRMVLALESFKAILRLFMLRLTNNRLLVRPPLPEREVDPSILQSTSNPNSRTPSHLNGHANGHSHPEANGNGRTNGHVHPLIKDSDSQYWQGTRSGCSRPTIASIRSSDGTSKKKDVNAFLLTKVLTIEDVQRPQELVKKLRSEKARISEILWILRPVIYVLAMRRFGQNHAYPFFLSLALETISHTLRQPQPGSGLSSEVEKQEYAKRKNEFWWYFVRGPVWTEWTKPQIEGIAGSLIDKPILGFAGQFMKSYADLIEEYYYYRAS